MVCKVGLWDGVWRSLFGVPEEEEEEEWEDEGIAIGWEGGEGRVRGIERRWGAGVSG